MKTVAHIWKDNELKHEIKSDDEMPLEKVLLNCEIKKNSDDSYTFILSDETVDADDEVVKADGWNLKVYKKNPVVLWSHNSSIPAIGISEKISIKDGKLVSTMRFAKEGIHPLADTIRALVDDKVIKAVSVGFIPLTREYPPMDETGKRKKPRVITLTQTLYEWSLCNIGCNPNALRESMMAKGYDEKSINEILSVGKEVKEEKTDNIEDSLSDIQDELLELNQKIDKLINKKQEKELSNDNKSIYNGLLEGAIKADKPSEKKHKNPFKN